MFHCTYLLSTSASCSFPHFDFNGTEKNKFGIIILNKKCYASE